MADGSFSWLLFFDGSGTPALCKEELTVHPAQPFPEPVQTQTIYLASGFPDLHPDSAVPLSPTLQLNGDRGNFSDDELQHIALAELHRNNAQRFRSYTVEADARVLVLGSSAQQLNAFLETYGGVLQLTPLLSTGVCEQFATASDPVLSTGENTIQLSFRTRAPLDKSRCTLCGICGPICPENSISEQLFLDLSQCTFCNACVKACPENAIDLHGVCRKTVEAHALLILDGVQTALDRTGSHIFSSAELEQLFASIYACRIDEVITCTADICQYSSRLETGCRLCLDSCPAGAISTTVTGIAIDQQQCRECGNCVAICPTGAIQYLRFSDQAFLDYFSGIELKPGCTVVLGNGRELQKFRWLTDNRYAATFFLEYPEVQALTSMHLLLLLARGAVRILLLLSGSPAAPLHDQIRATNTIIKGLFAQTVCVRTVTISELAELLAQQPEVLLQTPIPKHPWTNRREYLVGLLQELLNLSGRTMQLSGDPLRTFGRIECDTNACTLCLACLNECRIQALSSDSENWSLNLNTLACVQCGICVQVCPENALKQVHRVLLDQDAFNAQQLARAEPMVCRECGKAFGTRQSFERVMAILRHRKDQDDLSLYEYCDTCRVRKLYEAGK